VSGKSSVLSKVRTVAGWILVVIGILTTTTQSAYMFFTIERVGHLLFSLGILLIGGMMARRPQKGFIYVIIGSILLIIGMILAIFR